MPPEDAPRQPEADERAAVVAWIRDLRDREAQRNAGDPGTVLARRLSNAEFDYTIRDLTGVDIRPTREFPVDPANEAGFDNSGESLAMSPALLKKYLAAARLVADHVVLKPDGLAFAPHPGGRPTPTATSTASSASSTSTSGTRSITPTTSWPPGIRHRALGRPDADLGRIAAEAGLSPKYLAMVWSALTDDGPEAGRWPPCARCGASCRREEAGGAHRLRADARPGRAPAPAAQAQGRQAARQGDFRRQPAVRAVEQPPAGEPASQLFRRGCRRFPARWPISSRTRTPGWRSCSRRTRPTPRPNGGCAGAGALLCGLSRRLLRVRPRPVLRPERRRPGPAAHGRLPPHAGVFPRRRAAVRPGSRRRAAARTRRALARAGFRHAGADAAVPGLHLLRAGRAAALHARGRVRLRPLRGQGRDFRGEDRPAGRGVPGQGAQAGRRRRGAGGDRRPISPACRRRFAGSSRRGWPPSRGISRRWWSSPSGPIAGPCRPPSGTICWRSIASSAARTTWATRRRCATRSSAC